MAVRFNSDPQFAKHQFALNQAQQRSEAQGATQIPSSNARREQVRDQVERMRAKNAEPTIRERALAIALWSDADGGRLAVLRRLANGPIDVPRVLAACKDIEVADGKDADHVRSNVRHRLEEWMIEQVTNPFSRIGSGNAAASLMTAAADMIANATTTVKIADALDHLVFARAAMIPVESDARMRAIMTKKLEQLDALHAQGVEAFQAKAETAIANSEREGHPTAAFTVLNRTRKHLSPEQSARFDAVWVRETIGTYRNWDAQTRQDILDTAATCNFQSAERAMTSFQPSSPTAIDAAGAFLTDAERETARQVFAAHDAMVQETAGRIAELRALATMPTIGNA